MMGGRVVVKRPICGPRFFVFKSLFCGCFSKKEGVFLRQALASRDDKD